MSRSLEAKSYNVFKRKAEFDKYLYSIPLLGRVISLSLEDIKLNSADLFSGKAMVCRSDENVGDNWSISH